MKKICRTIKLKKYKTYLDELSLEKIEGNNFIICFNDGSWIFGINKDDLQNNLEKDHIKRIRFIFDFGDRICINRDVVIDTDEI